MNNYVPVGWAGKRHDGFMSGEEQIGSNDFRFTLLANLHFLRLYFCCFDLLVVIFICTWQKIISRKRQQKMALRFAKTESDLIDLRVRH
ncbi:MAG: hypothetical protein P4L53_15940 [Candidatus Obscuribacterales bacterium]|nr:hypothetical protein [Candidatus Obscuribacterales bacterium]